MALTARLELRQSQQLVMTPQLQQAIRLLQLSNLELTAFVEQELERNPLLERDEAADPTASSGESLASADVSDALTSAGPTDAWLDLAKPAGDTQDAFDTDIENVFPEAGPHEFGLTGNPDGWASRRTKPHLASDDPNLECYVACEVSLKDHLLAQMHLVLVDPVDRMVGHHLIDLVDEAGYLKVDLDALSRTLGAPDGLVRSVLGTLQGFDPTGVFARDLAECLALQLKDQNRFDPQIARVLANLDLLAAHDLAALRRAVGVDMVELADMIGELKRLDPKPGLRFGTALVHAVVPDVLVRPAADGGWIVELNTDTLPRVLVSRSYYTRISTKTRSARDKDYLADCLQNANWLVKSLDQRARTILRVAEQIVRQQDGFFSHGIRHLRPLNLKTVADAIAMHESTVSRVTSNKYMATPRGLFELKYFFTSAIAAAGDGEAHSSEAVRHRIRQLIDGEKPDAVFSDDKIVERLQADGIDIARRTVAKYREAMRISSSVQRRREKRLNGHLARPS